MYAGAEELECAQGQVHIPASLMAAYCIRGPPVSCVAGRRRLGVCPARDMKQNPAMSGQKITDVQTAKGGLQLPLRTHWATCIVFRQCEASRESCMLHPLLADTCACGMTAAGSCGRGSQGLCIWPGSSGCSRCCFSGQMGGAQDEGSQAGAGCTGALHKQRAATGC